MLEKGLMDSAYCVRADRGNYAEAFKKGDYAAIGWELGDLSGIPRGEDAALSAAYDASYPNDGKRRRSMNVGQIRRFLWEIESGDVVVTPTREPGRVLVGVAGERYYYETTPDCPFPHRREVRWMEDPILRSSLSVPIQNSLRAFLTVFKVRPPDELLQIAGLEAPTPEPVERIEENVSELVLGRLLELDADEFEILIAELLTTLGFEAEKIGRSGDGGVDVEGTLDVYGFANVELKVQAKRYKLGNEVNDRAVKEFRASVPEKAQASFVTTSTYTEKARRLAEREGFKRIGLIDGQQLVELLIQEYDRLPEEVREKLGLRRVLMPI